MVSVVRQRRKLTAFMTDPRELASRPSEEQLLYHCRNGRHAIRTSFCSLRPLEYAMANKKRRRRRDHEEARPLEIPMTDLNWSEDSEDPRPPHNDWHATGTPGGGLATGGLAGTNVGDGDPDNADLENAMGSGIHDSAG